MAININKEGTTPEETQDTYDIVEDRKSVELALRKSPEIDRLTSTIDVAVPETIVKFGAPAAEQISKASDAVLSNVNTAQLNDTSELMNTLAKLMDKFDSSELKENNGFLGKLFGGAKKQLDKILAKYNKMDAEINKIYAQLRQYEEDIRQSNQNLEQMFSSNVGFYHELVKYIVAGEQGIKEISDYREQLEKELSTSGDESLRFQIQTVTQAQQMLEQRVQDLRTAEAVAMQSIPMIRTMEYSNLNLERKINSAFIVTLPVFKQALAQAVLLKRQKVQAEGMAALDAKTNEMLLKNAENTAAQAKETARLSEGSSIKIETLEATWKTIVNGIEETKKIQEDARRKREEDKVKLESMKEEYKAMIAK